MRVGQQLDGGLKSKAGLRSDDTDAHACLQERDVKSSVWDCGQEMLADESEAVASVALDCIRLLCEADTLDFYGAWPVVVSALPGPQRGRLQVARRWVGLLACGALDAKAAPDQAHAVLELLWHAAEDESPLASHSLFRRQGQRAEGRKQE